MSSVEIDSSLERIIIDELTIFKTLSESKPERMSADVIAPVMTESTAARLPVPMPSEIIIMKLSFLNPVLQDIGKLVVEVM